ncbi:MAG TPA: TonB-dependent receptor [Vicingaceae bacterium]
MKLVLKIVLLGSFWLSSVWATAQSAKIIVKDKANNSPIYLAHVKFTDKNGNFKWTITDENGVAINPYSDSTLVEISFVGYEKFKANIFTKEEPTVIYLTSSSTNLEELVITGNFIPIQLKESVQKVETIDEEKINAKGAGNLREVLTSELNFRTNNGHVNETAINLNGLSGNHVKIMIDGIPIEGRLSGNIDISQINMNNIEKIEVIDGPTSVAYGTNALGGTINLITKKTQNKKITVQAKSFYETIGQYNFSGSLGFKHNKNTYKISGGRNFFQGFAQPDTSRFKTWKPREQYFGSFMYNRTIRHLKLTYATDVFTETMTDRGLPRTPYYITAFDTYYNTHRINNKLLLNGRVSPTHFVDVTLAHSYFKRTRNIYFKDLTTLNQFLTEGESDQDTTVFHTYLARTVYTKKNDSNQVNYSIGGELKHDKIIASRITNQEQSIGDYALFASLNYQPINRITIKPAVRYAYNTVYKAPVVPSLSFLVELNKNTQLRAAIAKGFRAPDLKELYLEFHYNSSINLWGNTDLKAENSEHINISLDWNKKMNQHLFQLSPKMYYSKINNLISLVRISEVDWQYQNINFLTTKGIALNAVYQINQLKLNGGFNYFGNYNSMFDDANVNNQFFYTTDINAGLGYQLDSLQMSFNILYKYTGKIRNLYLNNNQVNESFIGDFHTFDVTFNKTFYQRKINLTTGVKNLFNVTQVEMAGDVFGVSNQSNANVLNVLWGRSYFVSLTFNL